MTALNVEQARFNMIEQQVRPWDVLDFRVLDTLRAVRREKFVPAALSEQAFSDTMLPIGHGQVMMPPVVEGRMLQALDAHPGEAVLEIGTGTGFTAACLAHMGGQVTSVDIFPDLTATARATLAEQGFGSVQLETGDASAGWDNGNRYDVIAITGALPNVPEAYKAKLNEGGRLFVIVGSAPVMQALLITRVAEDEWQTASLFETCLPYLVNAEPKPVFAF
ncbi:MAG: protein-L-isoaspartate O-methyltransferase [Pseudomonadota bacterium]